MARTLGIGKQDFEKVRKENAFYIDKTKFIREWWESEDDVTLITRPRRFGKTLNMSMLEKFFSVQFAGRGDLFCGLAIWEDEKYRRLQGTYPVLFISFADVKETTYIQTKKKICRIIKALYNKYDFLLENDLLNESEKNDFLNISVDMEDNEASYSLKALSDYLLRYYKKKVIILLDEYDTPMQEAYVNGYWDELVSFTRSLFNATFKTNPYLERAIMTGISRVSKESIFSDLNNLQVITTTSGKYMDCFGFTEEEVFAAIDEYGLSEKRQEVKKWYDGFTFGKQKDIYNPWSILNYLDKRQIGTYWANSSSNSLAGKLIREGSRNVKENFEVLLRGKSIIVEIDEQIVYDQLDEDESAIWSLLLASGYLKVKNRTTYTTDFGEWRQEYELELTNFEVGAMFRQMIRKWFSRSAGGYNDFIKALLFDDVKGMNVYMNKVAMATFSYFDTGKSPSEEAPERFYHGFVLGLMVEMADRYVLTSNRESGFGRYDVMLEPRRSGDVGIIMEFKVQDRTEEKELSDTANAALKQIKEKEYESVLIEKGIFKEKIRSYGFAFCGKQVLIKKG
ncbi:MAG: AAA family ATPase [Lachnospiraceae bacterium]|nr:AAA family ATPase [Lachnospiraceae bacterium]